MPTLGEFISRARKYGFTLRKVGFDIHGPRGVTRIDYLGRDDPSAYAPLPDYPHDQRLTRNEVRSLCSQLGIDSRITRHQSAISVITGALAVLGLGAMALGLSRVSPLLKALWPF